MKKTRFFIVASAVTLAAVSIFGTTAKKSPKGTAGVYFKVGLSWKTLNTTIPTILTWNQGTPVKPTAFFKTVAGSSFTLFTANDNSNHKLYYK